MNKFSYDELFVGQTAEFSRAITAEMMSQFREVSGDGNPLHVDDNFAREKGFPARVVYGMLTAALYSCFVGEYIPGERCILQSVHADFLNPAFIGDTLTVSGKIVEKHDSVRQVVIKAIIRNQHGKKISRAKIEAGGVTNGENLFVAWCLFRSLLCFSAPTRLATRRQNHRAIF